MPKSTASKLQYLSPKSIAILNMQTVLQYLLQYQKVLQYLLQNLQYCNINNPAKTFSSLTSKQRLGTRVQQWIQVGLKSLIS